MIGGTGAMGGAVVRRLVRDEAVVKVLTRSPGQRENAVKGDLNDPESLREALSGVDHVFANTDFFNTGSVLGEFRQGIAVLEAARDAGVKRFIWSSLDGAAALTGGKIPVPHYDAKAAVAAHINTMRSEEFMRQEEDGWFSEHVRILTTAPYFENLYTLAPQDGHIFALPLGEGKWPLIALDDIAWFADHLFANWEIGDLAVVGESLSGAEIAAAFERVTGTPSRYQPVTVEAFPRDLAAMFRFFQERELDRDVSALREIHPSLMTFEAWLRATGWDGSPR
ncbi:NmrA family NAD(P)-binding protein [Winogradskya consettensis]|uniref:NmrA-like domain-containing protein n=1 Tax=Winogradskya consettensis TaxID=113560 RepID=A0A919T1U1_9ACTN|nr:hypothetical protein Aco04nite_78470 [Actinoplanes consettensis]